MKTIEDALALAVKMHAGQEDKSGKAFIMHPIRVATYLGPHASDEVIQAALLHDVVEDTDMTLVGLVEEGYSLFTVQLVNYMTRTPDETYKEYIHRIGMFPPAIELKLADLRDNMDPRRAITPEIRGMINNRYVWSKEYLESKFEAYATVR